MTSTMSSGTHPGVGVDVAVLVGVGVAVLVGTDVAVLVGVGVAVLAGVGVTVGQVLISWKMSWKSSGSSFASVEMDVVRCGFRDLPEAGARRGPNTLVPSVPMPIE